MRRRVIAAHRSSHPAALKPATRRRLLAAISVALIAAVLVYELNGLNDLRVNTVTGVDYLPAAQYIADRHRPGEAILTALPAPAFLSVGSTEDLIFLSSPLNRKRAQRYTRLTADGRYIDYWAGADTVVDIAGLCNTLLTAPNVWVLVDDSRLKADWAFKGTMAQVIVGMTYLQYEVEGGAQVRRLAPLPARDPAAEAVCSAALVGAPIPTPIPTQTP